MSGYWVGSSGPDVSVLTAARVASAARAGRPTFLAHHPTLPRLYAVDESDVGQIRAFSVDGDRLSELSRQPSGGSQPCHVLVHPSGGWLYLANYGDGVVTAISLDHQGDLTGDRVLLRHTGHGSDPDRQDRPHAHFVTVSAGGRWLIAVDLGTDQLRSYRLVEGRPVPPAVVTDLPSGVGPRHLVVHRDWIYLACELDGTVRTLRWYEPAGRAELTGSVSAIASGRDGVRDYPSHIERVGTTVLVAVRGSDAIAVIDIHDGIAANVRAHVPTVAWPRHFAVDRDGHSPALVVAGEREGAIGIHPLRGADARLDLAGVSEKVATAGPMCLVPQA
ncbi:MAG: lactonase family protein [Beutenbergiaceae bacterium]